jgi:hypothetical protein
MVETMEWFWKELVTNMRRELITWPSNDVTKAMRKILHQEGQYALTNVEDAGCCDKPEICDNECSPGPGLRNGLDGFDTILQRAIATRIVWHHIGVLLEALRFLTADVFLVVHACGSVLLLSPRAHDVGGKPLGLRNGWNTIRLPFAGVGEMPKAGRMCRAAEE